MSAVTPGQAIKDALALLGCAIAGTHDPLECITKAVPLLEDALLALPPIAASQLDPADRAAADQAAQAAEDEKFKG
jgi:hypothetical protein